jgi:signal transduction histidine kinase
MPLAFIQLFGLLTKPPGNLIYHLTLAFSMAAALPSAFQTWKSGIQPLNRRVVIALLPLLILRAALFLVGGLAWQGIFTEHALIPALERGAAILSLAIILWAWAFPQPQRFADAAAFLFSLLVLALSAFLTVWWYNQQLDTPFNGSLPDQITSFAGVGIPLLAILILLLRRPAGWGSGLIFFLVIAAGYLLHLRFPTPEEDYAGVVRLAELVAYPLLLILPQRLPLQLFSAELPAVDTGEQTEAAVSPSEVQLIQICLNLPKEIEEGKMGIALPRLIAQAMRADLCLLLSPPDEAWNITLHGGYDLIREQSLEGRTLDGGQTPTLAAALRHGKTQRMQADATTPDLPNLASAFHLSQTGHLLTASILDEDNNPLFGLVLLSPYSHHSWSSEEQDRLQSLTRAISKFLRHQQKIAALSAQREKAQDALASIQVSPAEQPESDQEPVPSTSPPAAPIGDTATLQGELRMALEEIARLREALEESRRAHLPAPESASLPNSPLANLAAELRQPLASIVGYTDFLLGESVGILGALQKKFLERIRIASQRMSAILDDYTPAVESQGAQIQLNPEITPFPPVLEKVTGDVQEDLETRRLQLQVNLPEDIPPLLADSGALEQILVKLIENAAQVSPEGESITISAEVKENNGSAGYLLLQVGDHGPGLSAEEIPHAFSRLRREPLAGVAESGASLYIVKTLVEALNGRIWIDSQPGDGAVFSMLFPLAEDLPSPDPNAEVKA